MLDPVWPVPTAQRQNRWISPSSATRAVPGSDINRHSFLTMPTDSPRMLKVFIGCPGDMARERAALLSLRDHLDELGCPIRFLTWKNATPGAGDAQKVIFDNFPIADWDIFIGLLWTRFGAPSGILDPLSGETLTGTESEFAGAYDAFLASGGKRPQILLYRCTRDLSSSVDVDQLIGVRKFFKQTETGAQRPALVQDFKTAEELKQHVTQDLVKVAVRLQKAGKEPAISATKGARTGKKGPDWVAAEESYRRHLCDAHRIVKFHTAEARRPVEVELEKVFIKLAADVGADLSNTAPVPRYFRDRISKLRRVAEALMNEFGRPPSDLELGEEVLISQKVLSQHIKMALRSNVHGVQPIPTTLSLSGLLHLNSHLALFGSPGSGKSTLLQYLVLTFASRHQVARLHLDEARLPVLIRLRQFHQWIEGQRQAKTLGELKVAHFDEFLAHQWREEKGAPELPAGFFKRLLRDDRAFILLDGLDEIAEPAQRRSVASLVATALDDLPQARVILTSRPKAWESEGRAALGSRVGEARICDLDNAQIEEFVRHWSLAATISARGDTPAARSHAESRAVDLIGAVKPERIRKLAATPLMLSILAMVHSRGVGLPQERSQLYHECIEFMLGYWDEIAGFSPDPELREVAARDRQTKRQLLEPVALWMHSLGSEQIEPLHDDLVKQFAAGFASVLNEPRPAAARHARAFLRLIVERGGLVQESEAGQFRFVHLTFQEYLAASAIAHGPEPFDEIRPHLHDPWWQEVILLAGGEISRQRSYRVKADTTAWLQGILDSDTWAEKHLLRDLQLAARCCAGMAETGVEPNITEEIASRLIWAVIQRNRIRPVTDISETIRGLPVGNLTKSIAEQLPRMQSKGDRFWEIPALVVSPLLPNAVIDAPLLEVFATARKSKDQGTSWWGNYLYLLHGPSSHRLPTLAKMRRIGGIDGLMVEREMVEKLLGLGDDALTEALREWWRAGLGSVLEEATEMLVRYGTEQDRKAALAVLVEKLGSRWAHQSRWAARQLRDLSAMADTPEVIAGVESIIARPEHPQVNNAVEVWEAISARRRMKIDVSPLERLVTHEGSSGWYPAVGALLRHGSPQMRLRIRKRVQVRLKGNNPDSEFSMICLLLENDPAASRSELAHRTEEIANFLNERRLTRVAILLGKTAWDCPHLITCLVKNLKKKEEIALRSIVTLIALWRVRPPSACFSSPSISDLAARTMSLAANTEDTLVRLEAVKALEALSNFSEFRSTRR